MPFLPALLRHRRWVIAFYLALGAAMLPGLARISQDNSPEVFFVRDAAALADFRELELHFGRARGLRVVVGGDGLWTAAGLAWLGMLEQQAQQIHGVIGAAGLYGHHRWRLPAWPPTDVAEFRREVLGDLLDRNAGWVGADGARATVLVGFYKLAPDQLRQTLQELDALLRGAPPGIEVALAGVPQLNRAMDEALTQMARGFFPPLALLAVLLVALVLRSPRHVALPFLVVAVCLATVFGAMGYAGARVNLVTIILAPLLFVITLATAVHVLLGFRLLAPHAAGTSRAVIETYRIKAWPVVWTGATTALGFGSLAFSPAPPVQSLGVWAAAGIGFMTIAMLSFYPALLAGIVGPAPRRRALRYDAWAGDRGRAWAQWAVRRRGSVRAAFVLLGVVFLAGALRLDVDANLRDYFAPGHPLRVALQQLDQAGVGAFSADLVLIRDSSPERRFDLPEELARLSELTAALNALPAVAGAVGVADLADGIARYAESGAAVDDRLDALKRVRGDPQQRPMLDYFLTRDAARTRITLFVPLLGYTELDPVLERARSEATARFPDAEVVLSGQYPLVLAAQRALLKTMVLSLTVTLLGIALVLRLVLGSTRLTLAAMLVNVWPVVFVLGLMGWSGIPVDSTTVMIAAVVLALAVDDTLHTLGYLRAVPRGRTPAAVAALERCAPAHLLTSVVLALGFGMLALSAFVPVARFGGLSALGIGAALAADLLLVPALLAALPAAAAARFRRAGGR